MYRIEYPEGKCCELIPDCKGLLEYLKRLKDETITDIRKVYKNGVSDSVMDTYAKYLRR